MGVDMIRTVLRIVLDDEDGHLRPEGAPGGRVYYHRHAEIVPSHLRERRVPSGARTRGVVVGQGDHLEAGDRALSFEFPELLHPVLRPLNVRVFRAPSTPERGMDMPLEALERSLDLPVFLHDHLPVASERDPRRRAEVPDKTRVGNVKVGVVVTHAPSPGIPGRPGILGVIRGVRGGRPGMAIGAHFGVHVKVVQEAELSRKRMVIGSNLLPEQDEGGVPVPFRHVTEDLVIGPVLFDDVDDVFDLARGHAHLVRDNVGHGRLQLRLLEGGGPCRACSDRPGGCSARVPAVQGSG